MRPDGPRPTIVGPDSGPEKPFPLRMKGTVVSGFGRGSKELGIPTANIPVTDVPWIEEAESGVYFGWAGIQLPSAFHVASGGDDAAAPATAPTAQKPQLPDAVPHEAKAAGWRQFPMVMSIGYNPFYKNTVRSAEVHVLSKFAADFYGSQMTISILGFIRPELDYVDVDSLIKDIMTDCDVARTSLDRDAYKKLLMDGYLWGEDEKAA